MATTSHAGPDRESEESAAARRTVQQLAAAIEGATFGQVQSALNAGLDAVIAALDAAERHTDREWLLHRAVGARQVLDAMAEQILGGAS